MLHAVVMAGGIGERFWPLSTPQCPKQLIPFLEGRSLLSRTIDRLKPLTPLERISVITSRSLESQVRDVLPSLPVENLLLEPLGKNTAPAAALVTLKILRNDPDAVIAMFPADHFIEGKSDFERQLLQAAMLAEQNHIVTFGIRPHYPATGYGYIRIGRKLKEDPVREAFDVAAFVEKPDLETAEEYVRDGGYLWNSGIFVWSGKYFLDQVETHAPDIFRSLAAIRGGLGGGDEEKAIETFYGSVKKISVDYAIMERSDRMVVIPASFTWDDLGSWDALERVLPADSNGNVVVGETILDDVHNSIIYSAEGTLALLGVRDLVVVRVGNVTMVCDKGRAEGVRKLAERWREKEGDR